MDHSYRNLRSNVANLNGFDPQALSSLIAWSGSRMDAFRLLGDRHTFVWHNANRVFLVNFADQGPVCFYQRGKGWVSED